MSFPKLPRHRSYNWFLFWKYHRLTIVLLTAQFAAFVTLGYIFYPKEPEIKTGQPVMTTPLAEKIAVHDAEFVQAMLEIIERDNNMEKERRLHK